MNFLLLVIPAVYGGVSIANDNDDIVVELPFGEAQDVDADLAPDNGDLQKDQESDGIIFPKETNSKLIRSTFKLELIDVIERLDRLCQLSEQQKQDLRRAGRVDQRRFFDRVQVIRAAYRAGTDIKEKYRDEIGTLQLKTTTGLHGSDSFFAKYARRVLDVEQLDILDEFRRADHANWIERTLEDVERIVELESAQREAFAKLLLEETPYPAEFENFGPLCGHSERIAMKYQLSLLADEKVKPLLNAGQWQELEPELREFRRYEPYLMKRGLVVSRMNNVDVGQK